MKNILILALSIFVFVSVPAVVSSQQRFCPANPTPDSQGKVPLCNPLEFDQYSATDIVSFASKILLIVSGFASLLPIVAVTYSGFTMVISQGNQEAVTKAKTSLTWAVMGFVISILSYVIIYGTINILGATNLGTGGLDPLNPAGDKIQNPLVVGDLGGGGEFVNFIYGLLQRFLQLVGAVAVLYLIISGFRYITSAGNEEQAKQAKAGLTWTAIGIVTILLSYVIIKAAAAIFGIS